MRCSNCGSNSAAGKRFCEDCGAPLANPCPKCGAETTAGKRFCGECGTPLDATAPAKAEPRDSSLAGERRHLTVLFCDLVGSTEIAAQLDPEEWRALVAGYHGAAAEAISRYGGHVAKYLGDGVMAYFGWPEAHENDAERAARAGLGIVERISTLNQESTKPTISVRIGIDSGSVVVGAGAGHDADVFGETPNIAARVQTAAAPDTVLITGATHRLLSGLFLVEERGAQELKGVANPVELYQVVRPSGVRGRLAAARGLTPFVGREEELRLLLSRWERAREGEGQLVLVAGEAGIGKSRLVAEFQDRIRDAPHIWIESAGEQFFENTPFHAIIEMLSRWLGLQEAANVEEPLERVRRALASAGLKVAEVAPLIVELLQMTRDEPHRAGDGGAKRALMADATPAPLMLTPEQRRRRLLAALVEWILGTAKVQPLVMVVEDLHWLDPSTLKFIRLLAEQGLMVPLMLICTARPEFHPQWPIRSHHTQITLNRLSARVVREMVVRVAACNALTSDNIEVVIERTGGVPLFVEELTRAVLESGAVKLSEREIPVTLHDSLMARLDRLGSAKAVLQLGSVIGGEFSHEVLRAVHAGSESELENELRKLTDADLLYFRGLAPDAIYRFKHALIRDAAYEALLKSRRKELHRLVASTINEKFPDLKQARPEVLARHWTEAGEFEPAIAEWSRAAKAAQERSAFAEAEESYEQALALLNLLTESPQRDVRELELRQAAQMIFGMIKGWAAPETINATQRLTALAERSGNLPAFHSSLLMRGFEAWMIAADYSTAGALADQALKLAQRDGNPTFLASSYHLELVVRFWRGDLTGVEQYFRAGLEFFDDQRFKQHPSGAYAMAFGYPALSAWVLGRPDLARERSAQMMAGVDPSNPVHLLSSAFMAGILDLFMRQYEQAGEHFAQWTGLTEQHQFANYGMPQAALGVVRAQLGREPGGVVMLREAISHMRALGIRAAASVYTVWLAEAEDRAGASLDALETIEQALKTNPDELMYRPEALRVRGELRAKRVRSDLAESDYRDAIALAQKMSAKAWELRAAISFARLLASQDRRAEAHSTLAKIYNWFTEGFDTADLRDAKALLDELNV